MTKLHPLMIAQPLFLSYAKALSNSEDLMTEIMLVDNGLCVKLLTITSINATGSSGVCHAGSYGVKAAV